MRYFNSIANIPELLRLNDNWLCWQKGQTDGRGKFPKYPVNPLNPSIKINYQDPRFLQSFDTAFNFYNLNNEISGLGFKLDGKKIYYPKINFKGYLAGIDIDLAEGRDEQFFKKITSRNSQLDPKCYMDIFINYMINVGLKIPEKNYQQE